MKENNKSKILLGEVKGKKYTGKKSTVKMILVIVGIVILLPILAVGASLMMWSMEDDIFYNIKVPKEVRAAEHKAVKYIKDKYGEDAKILDSEALVGGGGLNSLYISAIRIDFDGYSVLVQGKSVCDDRQYDELCSIIRNKYFEDKELGSSYIGEPRLRFDEISYTENCGRYTSAYFDGNLEKFISEASPKLYGGFTYEGYPEKYSEYRQLLEDKLTEIGNDFENVYITVHIHDPSLDLPEMPYNNRSHSYRYEKYMELIAYGTVFDSGVNVYQTEFYEIDEYTAVSDDRTPITSGKDVAFYSVDLSYNTTAYRGRFRYDDRADKNVLTTRNEGWRIWFNDRKGYDVLIRLDREHYNITDKTIPLIIADVQVVNEDDRNKYDTRRCYLTVGYGDYVNVDTNYDDWYYLDDDYLYLCISSYQVDLETNDWILTFSDSELPE